MTTKGKTATVKDVAKVTETTVPVTTTPGVVATVPPEYQAFTGPAGRGQGWDNVTAADIAIPFLNLLQDGSPQVKKASSSRIEGAEAGFFIDSVSNELYGDKGVIVVPVYTEPKVVEWIPRNEDGSGGGLVGVHKFNGPEHQRAKAAAGGDVTNMFSADGSNELKETFYMYAMILATEDATEFANSGVMVAFSKSKIKPYRIGMGRINKVKGSADLPLFCNRLRLTGVPDTGKGNDYMNIQIEPIFTDKGTDPDNVIASRIPGVVDGQPNPLLLTAQKFYEGLVGGTVKVDYAQQTDDGGAKTDAGEVKDKHF